PYAVVRSDVERLLHEAETASADAPPEARQEALFAVCAFVDEAILTSSWQGRQEWARATLQRTRFGTVNAGMEFYEHCQELLQSGPPTLLKTTQTADDAAPLTVSGGTSSFSEYLRHRHANRAEKIFFTPQNIPQDTARQLPVSTAIEDDPQKALSFVPWREEVLCLYGACLSMGFTGRYYDDAARETLRDVALASLEQAVGGRVTLHQRTLSPEAYCMPEVSGPRKGQWFSYALILAVPVLSTFLLYKAYEHTLDAYVAQWIAALGGVLQ
ncbi:MAG: DotU family type IV/VI secretion system protein, partial [Desulfovibrionaceae bacterium]|nr:DotU family type IV/VI secretion system protein [Desulfovibrionaceae bacterium]